MIQNFSWVVPDKIAVGHMPGGRGNSEEADLTWLKEQGITCILSLTTTPLDTLLLAQHGFTARHLPVRDFAAPDPHIAQSAVALLEHWLAQGKRAYVHCAAGYGRSGTIMACYFVRQGLKPEEAIAHIRRLRAGSVETPEQERFVHEFARLEAEAKHP
jgi:atypical dual specificity phosphatase